MPIAGGMDIHRKQIIFDYAGLRPGRWCAVRSPRPACGICGPGWNGSKASPMRRSRSRRAPGGGMWPRSWPGPGVQAHLAGPADTAAARGRKKRAKTDRADSRLMRDLLLQGRLPGCWIPPEHVLECRALLETYHALRREHTAWVQRAHAVLFHQGATRLREGGTGTAGGRELLREIAAGQLSPAGQQQISLYLRMLEVTEAGLDALRGQLTGAARSLAGAKTLREQLYGVGPVTALALTGRLGGTGRFSPARNAVRFAGLDITVYSSAGKRCPGHLSPQGPPVLRWCAYEAGKVHAHGQAPDHGYYAQVKDRIDGKRRRPVRGPQDHPPGMPPARRARRRRARHGVTRGW